VKTCAFRLVSDAGMLTRLGKAGVPAGLDRSEVRTVLKVRDSERQQSPHLTVDYHELHAPAASGAEWSWRQFLDTPKLRPGDRHAPATKRHRSRFVSTRESARVGEPVGSKVEATARSAANSSISALSVERTSLHCQS
jgi:hypothetical protein